MSAYIEGQATIQSLEDLISALCEMGYTKDMIEIHDEPVALIGYRGDTRKQKANVIVRRAHVGGASNDLGFVRGEKGYNAIVSEYDIGHLKRKHKCAGSFLDELVTRSAVCAAEKVAAKRGFKTSRKQVGHKIHLVLVG